MEANEFMVLLNDVTSTEDKLDNSGVSAYKLRQLRKAYTKLFKAVVGRAPENKELELMSGRQLWRF